MMFGHQDDKDKQKKDDKENVVVPDESADQPVAATANVPDTTPATDSSTDDNAWQHPGIPLDDSPEQIADIIGPAGGTPQPSPKPPIVGGPGHHAYSNDVGNSNDSDDVPTELVDIKQKALTELLPMIDKLDQTPEDRFRTIMMIIQSSDDQNLVKKAYDAAEGISDEKARGQALLDIVNEINYFTQRPESTEN